MDLKYKRVYVAGSEGMVGSAIVRKLRQRGYQNLLTASSAGLDLRRQCEVEEFFQTNSPEIVIVAAARVGGIRANQTRPADFIYDNLMIEANVIHTAYRHRVNKLLFLGSSCVYSPNCPQPLREEYLLSGPLESTNEPYALAKIAGIKLCESYFRQYGCNFFSVTPPNLYGPHDNFELESSHVIPAMLRKFHEARSQAQSDVEIWGSGRPKREFLFVEDLAEAVVFLISSIDAAELYAEGISHINIGTGTDLEISQLAEHIKDIVGFSGTISYDTSKPNGTPRNQLDVSHMTDLGWKYSTELMDGLKLTYEWFVQNEGSIRTRSKVYQR